MKTLLQLNLRDESVKPANTNPTKTEGEEPKNPVIVDKRLNRMARKAAHRAATHSGGGTGLFSK
jgi:hypothetical protein